MQNMAFTAKGDHIAWTQMEQSTVSPVSMGYFFFAEVWYLYTQYWHKKMLSVFKSFSTIFLFLYDIL